MSGCICASTLHVTAAFDDQARIERLDFDQKIP